MSLQVIDYLEGYNNQCSRRSTAPLTLLQHVLANSIDQGMVPRAFILRGNHKELRDRRLTDEHLDIIIVSFGQNNFLSKLDLSFNCITDKGAAILADWLQSAHTLQELILSTNNIGSGACASLSDALVVNTSLHTLDLSHNAIGNEGALALAGVLQVNTTLKRLMMRQCDVSLPALIALCTVLHQNCSLESMDISNNVGAAQHSSVSLHQDFMRHLSLMCGVNKTISELYLAKLNIDDNDMVNQFAPALSLAANLKVLDLSSNRIMQDGAKAIAESLVFHPSLIKIYLSNNTISSPGMNYIARMLKDNTQLTDLYLDNVGAGTDALLGLAQVLISINTSLRVVKVWGNHFYLKTETGMSLNAVKGVTDDGSTCCETWDLLLRNRIQINDTDVCLYQVSGEWHVAHNTCFGHNTSGIE